MDIATIPGQFDAIDLLWCEGAAYNIGFENAIKTWKPALMNEGLLVVSELCWLNESRPPLAARFFERAYPPMKSLDQNRQLIEQAEFQILETHILPDSAWIEGYYDVLGPRAERLSRHEDESVRAMANETSQEIEVFQTKEGSYGYVFFSLKPS